MKVLDLFSGIGGFSLGLERAGMETIAFCEIEAYPRKVLTKHWPDIPIASDVTKLTYQDGVLYDDGEEIYRGSIDLICGGFPCQDISVAGKQKGIEGERSGLWSECARLLREVRPDYAIFENVTALLSGEQGRWFQRVLFDISEVGYDAEWHCISASELGAFHERPRVWIIAYPIGRGSQEISKRLAENVCLSKKRTPNPFAQYFDELWLDGLGDYQGPRISDGVPNRSHRLKALGNAVVPQIPELIGRAILESHH